jgi:hypothetical protein
MGCGSGVIEEVDQTSSIKALAAGEVSCESADPFWRFVSVSQIVSPGVYRFTTYLNGQVHEWGGLTFRDGATAELYSDKERRITGYITHETLDPRVWTWRSADNASFSIPFTCAPDFQTGG